MFSEYDPDDYDDSTSVVSESDITGGADTDVATTDLETHVGDDENNDDIGDTFIPKNKYAEYKIVYIPEENPITPDVVNRYEYCELMTHGIQRIEKTGFSFVTIGNLDCADKIADAEIKARKCPILLRRVTGYSADDDKKILYAYYEIHNPNDMIHLRK